ncbi:arylamine N-acetyltransferase family protein [Roseibium sp.]|uniref:arylamine N-acetyltransferase family protein n=1 Tax=Roseibium sp. TaxID=1936156 RepID=UPI003A96DFE8
MALFNVVIPAPAYAGTGSGWDPVFTSCNSVSPNERHGLLDPGSPLRYVRDDKLKNWTRPVPFDLPAYLSRIGLTSCAPTIDGLRQVQGAQMQAIAFENVLPFLGQVPDVSLQGVCDKLVTRRCGGYCFELNTLYGAALEAIGFEIKPVLARVRKGAPQGGARTHLAFVATIDDEEWLTDTGFGGPAPIAPIRLGTDAPQNAGGKRFRIVRDEITGEEVLERESETGWYSLYGFDRVAPTSADIEAANFLCATWDKTPFPQNLLAFRTTPAGKLSFQNGFVRNETTAQDGPQTLSSLADIERFFANDLGLGYDHETIKQLHGRLLTIAE